MAIVVGSVAVDVTPSTKNFWRRFKAQTQAGSDKAGRELGEKLTAPLAEKLTDSVTESVRKSSRKASPAAKKTGREIGDKVSAPIKIKVQESIQDAMRESRKRSSPAAKKTGEELGEKVSAPIKEKIRESVDDSLGKTKGTRTGEEFGSAWAKRAATFLKRDIEIGAQGKGARAELQRIHAAAQRLSRERVSVQVDVDGAAGAITQLAAVNLAARNGSKGVNIFGDTIGQMFRGLPQVISQIAGLGSSLGRLGPIGWALSSGVMVNLVVGFTSLAAAVGASSAALAALAAALGGGLIGLIGTAVAALGNVAATINAISDPATPDKTIRRMLQNITKQERKFVKFWQKNMTPILDQLSTEIRTPIFEGLEAGLKAMRPLWPIIGKAIKTFAKILGQMFQSMGKALSSPWWQSFFRILGTVAVQAGKALVPILGDLARMFAILFIAFAPLIAKMIPGLVKLTRNFVSMVESWTKSDSFDTFINYIIENGPRLLQLFGALAVVVVDLLVAFAPFAEVVLPMLIGALGQASGALRIFAKFMWWLKPIFKKVYGWLRSLGKWFTKISFRIGDRAQKLWKAVKSAFTRGGKTVSKVWNRLWTGLIKFVVKQALRIRAHAKLMWARVRVLFSKGKTWVADKWSDLWTGLRDRAVKLGNRIKNKIDNVLSGIKKAFRSGVKAIGKIWDGLKSKLRSPIVAMIRVINGGIVAKYNKLARFFKLPKSAMAPPLSTKGFATGGYTGPGSKYKPAGVVHADEFVVKKTSRKRFERENPGALDHINRTGKLPGYAEGGLVDSIGTALKNVTNPFRWIQRGLGGALGALSGGEFYEMLRAVPKMLLREAKKFIQEKLGFSGNAAAIIKMAKSMDGAPYVWGGASRNGADCSGFMSILRNVGKGEKNPFHRVFSTASFGGGRNLAGFRRGANSAFQIGVTPGSHMAGRVKNPATGQWVGVESGGSYGRVKYGSNRNINGFTYQYGFTDWARNGFANGGQVKLDKKSFPFPLEGLPGMLFDSGGYIPPGLSLVANGTGRPEAVLDADQTRALEQGRFGGGPLIDTVNIKSTDPRDSMDELRFWVRHIERGGRYAAG